jgi:DNA repair exonuclease SbcCD ATPase subunit
MKSLKVKIARAERFGRLSSKSVELSDGNFTVVFGPNESGKSTLAELISWVLAGRRQEMDRRFLTSSEIDGGETADLMAGIEGFIDGKSFTASRKFTVRPTSKGKEKTVSAPELSIDTKSISLETWQHEIGVRDEDDYLRYYRITGPNDPSNKIDLKDVLTALAVGADVNLPPRKVAKFLEDNAEKLVAGQSGRKKKVDPRKFEEAEDDFRAARAQLKEIESSAKEIQALRSQISEAEDNVLLVDGELAQKRKEHEDLDAAKKLMESRVQRDSVASRLREFAGLSDSDSRMYEQRADIRELIRNINSKSLQIATLSNELEKKQLSIGLNEIELSKVSIDVQIVEKVRGLHEDRSGIIRNLEQLEIDANRLEADRKDASERLGRFATQFEVSASQLMAFGQLSLDDVSFGDPIRDWEQAEKLSFAPIETENSQPVEESSNSIKFFVALAVFGTLLATGSQFVIPDLASTISPIGLVISVVAGFLAIFGKRASSKTNSTSQISVAPSAVKRDPGVDDRKKKALKVLQEHGFNVQLSVEKAMSLRGSRSDIKNLVAAINSNSQLISANSLNIASTNEQLNSINADFERLSTQIGLSSGGSDLLPSFARELHEFMVMRVNYGREHEGAVSLRNELDTLTEMRYSDQSIAQIELIFSDLCAAVEKRNALEGERKSYQTLIELGAPSGSRIAQLLQDTELSESVIDGRLEDLISEIDTGIGKRQFFSDSVAVDRSRLEALEVNSDLPTFTYAEKQSETDMAKWATEGAAVLLAKKIVLDVANDVEAKNQPGLVKRSSEIASEITDGFWSNLKSDEGGVRVLQNGQWITEDALSAGARDVLRFSIRLAAAEAHSSKHGIALPLILDDPTSSVDSKRRPLMLKVLNEFSRNHQVILLTHEPDVSQMAVSLGATQVLMAD